MLQKIEELIEENGKLSDELNELISKIEQFNVIKKNMLTSS